MLGRTITIRRHRLGIFILMVLIGFHPATYAVEFNTEILDTEDKDNIDLSRFSEAGYIMPGTYSLGIKVNNFTVQDADVTFYERQDKQGDSEKPPVEACITHEQLPLFGLKHDAAEEVLWWHDDQCADFSNLPGILSRGDLSKSELQISIPQAWIEYQDASWVPSARWEDGLPGILFDYNVNTNVTKPARGQQTQNMSGSGTTGANMGAWRVRGDWQASYNHTTGSREGNRTLFDWSRIYAYRALRDWHAKLTVGEDYLTSDLFDSWRFTGMSLISDDRMLPPRLRGYAPEVTGIARTNAKVSISQQGRVLYETTVAAGPFNIQDLSSAVNGKLDVRVEEQDGSVQTYQVDTASIPYLTRPGQVRYKFAMGRPSDYQHHAEGPGFGTTELSWGISNAWSLYGGAIVAGDYNSLAVGVGRDLLAFGTVSADITQSVARLPDEKKRQGKSWRVSYSKRFDELNSEITFAGYRFSERDYMSMGEYIDYRYRGNTVGHNKELYTVTANKSFEDLRMSAYLSWSHQTYWDRQDNDRYSLSLSKYFDLGDMRNMSATLSATRSEYNGLRDDMAYLNLSVPFGNASASYNGTWNNNRFSQTVGWSDRLENGDTYSLQAGTRHSDEESFASQASAYYTHNGDIANMTANMSWSENDYSSFGMSLAGGMTATTKGAALHPNTSRGGTRMMISTEGVSGVPIENYQHTNVFGITVIPDVPSYYRNSASINVNTLPDDVETSGSPVADSALTEGAIGFRQFDVLKGAKFVAILRLADGTHPPFGATVTNKDNRELGLVSDGGLAWLTGVKAEEELSVSWGGETRCTVQIPKVIPADQILLPCNHKH